MRALALLATPPPRPAPRPRSLALTGVPPIGPRLVSFRFPLGLSAPVSERSELRIPRRPSLAAERGMTRERVAGGAKGWAGRPSPAGGRRAGPRGAPGGAPEAGPGRACRRPGPATAPPARSGSALPGGNAAARSLTSPSLGEGAARRPGPPRRLSALCPPPPAGAGGPPGPPEGCRARASPLWVPGFGAMAVCGRAACPGGPAAPPAPEPPLRHAGLALVSSPGAGAEARNRVKGGAGVVFVFSYSIFFHSQAVLEQRCYAGFVQG